MRHFLVSIVALAAALLSGAAGCHSPNAALESRSAVRGSVKVAGKAAPGLIVRSTSNPERRMIARPQLVETLTDAGGEFRVSQNSPNDGLAPGKYTVTFFWPPGGDTEAPVSVDQLKGRYLKPEKSQFHVTIQSGANELTPFELK